jgi:hypothetical protein
MLAVPENIGSGLVNRYRPGIGRRIGLFLSYVKLKGFKFIVTHGFNLLFSFYVFYCGIQDKSGQTKTGGLLESSRAKNRMFRRVRPCLT